jgi:hypothetical protein
MTGVRSSACAAVSRPSLLLSRTLMGAMGVADTTAVTHGGRFTGCVFTAIVT